MDGMELKLRRVRAGLTLYALGQRCGVHPSRLSEMERGERPIGVAVVEALDENSATASTTSADVEG